MDNTPVLSCSVLAARADGHEIYTLEGLQEEAAEFVGFIADQGADQCGFCNPGFVMNTIALLREIRIRRMMRSGHIWQETSADAPAMKDSCGASGIFWIREEVKEKLHGT